MLKFNFSFPMVLDNMTNEVDDKYKAMPERLYVLDADGRVTWKCGIGPHFFDPTGFKDALKNYGFKVNVVENANYRQFRKTLEKF